MSYNYNLSAGDKLRLYPESGRKSYFVHAGIAQLVEHNLAKVGVAGSNPVSRSKIYVNGQQYMAISTDNPDTLVGFSCFFRWRRTQVAKGEVCKTFMQRFKSARRLQP